MNSFPAMLRQQRWIWAAAGVLILWAALSVVSERASLSSLTGIARSVSFLTLVALGQMFVVTTGRGNIDLSVASVVTLSAFITVTVSGGTNAGLPLALAAAVAAGAATGLLNAFLVLKLRIAAMIATLSTGYILATATLMINRQVRGFDVAPALRTVATERVLGVPVIALIALAAVAVSGIVLSRTAFGMRLAAVGQNLEAARLAGIRTGATITAAFITSGVLAAASGALLSAYVGGAFLDMGTPFLLQSIGAVVLGGTLIFGGSSTAVGTLFGAMFLILIVTTMQVAGLPTGAQDVVQGTIIIAVLAIAGLSTMAQRRRRLAAES
ncbi:ABC transporter permease [Chelativorans sp.]|uniref:ABC transporter permease n=1 Tax=Chelativorans sp. TaxID=2203393 RepID=UPI0028111ACF|nr:ABC transporter permease [Chelativorans sp.]